MEERVNRSDSWKWAMLMTVFGVGMTGVTVFLIRKQITDIHDFFLLLTVVLSAFSSFVIALSEYVDYIRERKQIMADISCYTEFKRQQPEEAMKVRWYARYIFTEHAGNMYWEIYWNQLEGSMSAGWLLMLICGVCIEVSKDMVIYPMVIVFGIYMFSGFLGCACRRIKRQIREKGLDAGQVERDYMQGVVYAFVSGYVNVCPHYTFVIRGKNTAVIRNADLLRISENFHQTEMRQAGIRVGNINSYSVTIVTKDRESYTITCNSTVGTLIMGAVNRKIRENMELE